MKSLLTASVPAVGAATLVTRLLSTLTSVAVITSSSMPWTAPLKLTPSDHQPVSGSPENVPITRGVNHD